MTVSWGPPVWSCTQELGYSLGTLTKACSCSIPCFLYLKMDLYLLSTDSLAAMEEANIQCLGAACPLSGTPGAIWMHQL